GLPELLAVSNHEFIAIERAFADGVGNTIRLTRATIEPDTTDVRSFKSLVGASYKPMKRELLLEMPVTYQGVKLDNIEGISWGPRL
ncbi:esterase-like activity of phytase family protein, partial [Klebsiella pneumoniae]